MADEVERDRLRAFSWIDAWRDAQVTLQDCRHVFTQTYCSALPVACSGLPAERWAPFARPVLEAAYEATLCAATLNAASTGDRRALLTS